MQVFSCMFIFVKRQPVQPRAAVIRTTWRTLKANMVVGADVTVGLFLVDAPEALLQTGVDHLPSVCCWYPVCCASLHGCGPRTNSLSVIEADSLQALVVSVPPRMVDVEPRRPFCHTWRHTEGRHGWKPKALRVRISQEQKKERKQSSTWSRNKEGGERKGVGAESYMEGRRGSEPRKIKMGENSRDRLQILRGGLLLPFETDVMHPRESCVAQVLSKPHGLTDEAHCLFFVPATCSETWAFP